MNLGKLLEEARIKRGLHQTEVAKAVGCSKASISLYESNERTPSAKILISLLDLYCLSLESVSAGREYIDITDCSEIAVRKIYRILELDKQNRQL